MALGVIQRFFLLLRRGMVGCCTADGKDNRAEQGFLKEENLFILGTC